MSIVMENEDEDVVSEENSQTHFAVMLGDELQVEQQLSQYAGDLKDMYADSENKLTLDQQQIVVNFKELEELNK